MKYLLSIIFATLLNISFSQSPDMVRLKDGSIIKGEIVDYRVNQYVKIKTIEGNILNFPISDVAKTKTSSSLNIPLPSKGFFNNTSIGILVGNIDNTSPVINFHTVTGYQLNEKWLTGIGMGVDRFSSKYYGSNNTNYFPLYADIRYLLRKSDVTPFVSIKGGYAFHFSKKEDFNNYDILPYYSLENKYGGFHSGIQIGIRNYTKANFGYTLSAGYTFQRTKREYYSYFWNGESSSFQPITEYTLHHRFEIKFGIYLH